jgi:hypothetical protein
VLLRLSLQFHWEGLQSSHFEIWTRWPSLSQRTFTQRMGFNPRQSVSSFESVRRLR